MAFTSATRALAKKALRAGHISRVSAAGKARAPRRGLHVTAVVERARGWGWYHRAKAEIAEEDEYVLGDDGFLPTPFPEPKNEAEEQAAAKRPRVFFELEQGGEAYGRLEIELAVSW